MILPCKINIKFERIGKTNNEKMENHLSPCGEKTKSWFVSIMMTLMLLSMTSDVCCTENLHAIIIIIIANYNKLKHSNASDTLWSAVTSLTNRCHIFWRIFCTKIVKMWMLKWYFCIGKFIANTILSLSLFCFIVIIIMIIILFFKK